jgi:hypothetical protein
MPNETTKSIHELLDEQDALEKLRLAMDKRKATVTDEREWREIDALVKRACDPQCAFDRQHNDLLFKLAIEPHVVSGYWRLREWWHRFIHHH